MQIQLVELVDNKGLMKMKENISNNSKVKGLVTIRILDAKTLEVKRTIEKENTFVVGRVNQIVLGNNHYFHSGYSTTIYSESNILFTDLKFSTVDPNVNIFDISQDYGYPSSKIKSWTFYTANPDYFEATSRWNAPSSLRTVNTIFLAGYNSTKVGAYVSLSEPCTQGTTEILDITYRVMFFYDEYVNSEQTINPMYNKFSYMDYFRNQLTEIRNLYYAWNPHKNSTQAGKYRTFSSSGQQIGTYSKSVQAYNGLYYRNRVSTSNTETGNGGDLISTINYGFTSYGYYCSAASLPNSSTRKPVQNIRSHSDSAIQPFLDVDNLAGGTGSFLINGDNWDDAKWPKYFRIEHKLDGQVNASSYMFRKRVCLGFESGTSYRSSLKANSTYRYRNGSNVTSVQDIPLGKDYGITSRYNSQSFGGDSLVSWDNDGVCVQRQTDGQVVVFDSIQYPGFALTDIREISIDNNNSLYVASSTSGMVKISDVWGTPMLEQITVAGNGVPSDTGCYATCQGYNDRIWAMFEGGLSYTNDGGTTWTNLDGTSSPIFSVASIEDGNWSTVMTLEADRDAPDHHLALATQSTSPQWSARFYTPANGGQTSYAGDIARGPGTIRCSHRGGLWIMIWTDKSVGSDSFDSSHTYKKKFLGSTIYDIYNHGPWSSETRVSFLYDYYNNPLPVVSENDISGQGVYRSGGDKSRIVSGYESNINPQYNSVLSSFEENPNGYYLGNSEYSGSHNERFISLSSISGLGTGKYLTLNHQYSEAEEWLWKKYHWNGNDWEHNYYAKAIDTGIQGNGQRQADRHNFDTESHFFTGRSMIDVTPAFPQGVIDEETTFVFTLTPSSKFYKTVTDANPKGQTYQSTIFEVVDRSISQRLTIVWRNNDDNIVVIENTTLGQVEHVVTSTPVDNVAYRIVVAINNLDFNIYIDAVAQTSITLGAAMSFINALDDLSATLGCRNSAYGYNEHSDWPEDFYRGTMENVQFWNVEWDQADVDNDLVDQVSGDGLISSKPGTNLIARYELTQSLESLETKRTHTSEQPLDEDLTITFEDGATGTSFISGDYHTFGVANGILKDNAMTWSSYYDMYTMPTDVNFSELLNTGGSDFIPSLTTTQVTSPMGFNGLATNSTYWLGVKGGLAATGTNDVGCASMQPMNGDGWIEGTMSMDGFDGNLCLHSDPTSNDTAYSHGLQFHSTGNVSIREANGIRQSVVSSHERDDRFRVQRVGTVVSYYKYINNILTQIGVDSTISSNGQMFGKVYIAGSYHGIHGLKINYTSDPYIMYAGNISSETGCFDPEFICLDAYRTGFIDIFIGGSSERAVVRHALNQQWLDIPPPGPGEVTIIPQTGQLIFNSADQGKTVTGGVPVVYWKAPTP